jgi:adenosylcobinamide-GDP ribazoletransferase
VRSLLAFFTVLPLGRTSAGDPLGEAARRVHLLPVVGLAAGLPGGLILLSGLFPPAVGATLALGGALLVAGLHHTDGVLDTGDALMVRGSPERRRRVLKDLNVGAGALGAAFLVYAPALAALGALAPFPGRAAVAMICAEVAARSAMLLMLVFGKPAEGASSSLPFVRALRERRRRLLALLLALAAPPVVALASGPAALAVALLAAPLVAGLALLVAGRLLGGIGGDVVGAGGELTRAVLLVCLSATL